MLPFSIGTFDITTTYCTHFMTKRKQQNKQKRNNNHGVKNRDFFQIGAPLKEQIYTMKSKNAVCPPEKRCQCHYVCTRVRGLGKSGHTGS